MVLAHATVMVRSAQALACAYNAEASALKQVPALFVVLRRLAQRAVADQIVLYPKLRTGSREKRVEFASGNGGLLFAHLEGRQPSQRPTPPVRASFT